MGNRAFDIEYKPQIAIMPQSLADFIVDWTKTAENTGVLESEYSTLQFDGSRALEGSGLEWYSNHPKEANFFTCCK